MNARRFERTRGAYHLLNLHLDKLKGPFQLCHLDTPRLSLWAIGKLHYSGGSHRRGEIDEEHGDRVLGQYVSVTSVYASFKEGLTPPRSAGMIDLVEQSQEAQ